jgi:hypothetical protein
MPNTNPVASDLTFIYYKPNKDIPEESFQITAYPDGRGEPWLWANTSARGPDNAEDGIPEGNCWINTRAQFEQLYTKALADGMTVEREEG